MDRTLLIAIGQPLKTKEGLDAILSITYYARMRFIQQLLQLHPKHVLSVLGGTLEKPINMSDLALQDPKNYSFINTSAHDITMTSLSFEYLAKQYPNTAFVHAFPDFIKTPIIHGRDIGWFRRSLMSCIFFPLRSPWRTDLVEAGRFGLFYLTSKRYASLKGADGVELVSDIEKAGRQGAYLVGSTGSTGAGPIMKEYREQGVAERIWNIRLDCSKR